MTTDSQIQVEFCRVGVPLPGGTRTFDLDELGAALGEVIEPFVSDLGDRYDLLVSAEGAPETSVSRFDRGRLSLREVLERAARGELTGKRFRVDATGEHVGAGAATLLPLRSVRVVASASFARGFGAAVAQKTRVHGPIELSVAVRGVIVGDTVAVLDLVVVDQEADVASFRMTPVALSRALREAARDRPREVTLGWAHTHPTLRRPLPSGTDDSDRDAMSRLLAPHTRTEVRYRAPLSGEPTVSGVRFPLPRLARRAAVVLPVVEGAPSPVAYWEESIPLGTLVFLIFPADGGADRAYLEVVRVPFDRLSDEKAGPAPLEIIEDVPLEVLPDDEVAALVGRRAEDLPTLDIAAIEAQIRTSIRRRTYGGYWERYDGPQDSFRTAHGYRADEDDAGPTPATTGAWGHGRRTPTFPVRQPDELVYLRPRSTHGHIADVLSEAAAVLSGTPVAGSYLAGNATREDVFQAVWEALWLLGPRDNELRH